INHIKTQIQRLRDGHRAISLIIEGITKIGKTELIWAICKELERNKCMLQDFQNSHELVPFRSDFLDIKSK
ncbi:hypothetical protein, partial [Candidatus Phytoplasma melaleucae]